MAWMFGAWTATHAAASSKSSTSASLMVEPVSSIFLQARCIFT